jgi:glutamate N-acetyltransferase/amino-acid N-acetyltransferase
VSFSPDRIALSLNGVPVYRDGSPVISTRKRAEKAMKAHDLLIEVDLSAGGRQARVWTCDLSHDYVDINGSYIT